MASLVTCHLELGQNTQVKCCLGTKQVPVGLGRVSFQIEEGRGNQATVSSAMVWAWDGRRGHTELAVAYVRHLLRLCDWWMH